jgi:hypothetical protein
VHSAAAPFTSHSNECNYAEPKPFSLAKLAFVGFSSSNFTVQDHILSTAGDALISLLKSGTLPLLGVELPITDHIFRSSSSVLHFE